MEQAISKAAALVEAHEYIRRFKDRVVVVKVGGSIMDQPEDLQRLDPMTSVSCTRWG